MENRFDELQIVNKANSSNTYFRNFEKAYEEATSETIPWKQKVKSKYHGIQMTYQTGLSNFVIYLI